MTNIDYTLWPNAGGTLGQNKVQIPDGITTTWPAGDALVGNFVYNKGNLVGFVDTKALIANESKSTTFPYDYVNIQVDKSLEDVMTFNQGERTKYLTVSYTTSGNSSDESFDFVIIDFNTADQETIDAVRSAYRVVDKKMYDVDGNVIGTWDSSKIEVGGVFDMENMVADGVYCNFDLINEKDRGLTLTEFDSDLSSLRDGYVMFGGCSGLTSFSSDLSSLANGGSMFSSCTNLTSFSSDLTKLKNGENMFVGCSNLTSFNGDLSSLTNGYNMFQGCSNLTTFSSNLSSLTNGKWMFEDCVNLTSFSSDLSSLTNAYSMFFNCSNLTSFSSDLSSLTDGYYMFFRSGLTSFSSDLSSLTDGNSMFYYCENLTSFNSDLRSLTNGVELFHCCKLDAPSVKNIIDTINTYSGRLYIGMGCNNTTEDKNLFAQEVGYSDMTSLLAALESKGWDVDAQYTGRPTTTYGLRRPTEDNLPVFAKLEEAEKHATHTSEDGTKKYRLNWFHETTGSTEGYTQFNSLEEAVAYFNVKPIERN